MTKKQERLYEEKLLFALEVQAEIGTNPFWTGLYTAYAEARGEQWSQRANLLATAGYALQTGAGRFM